MTNPHGADDLSTLIGDHWHLVQKVCRHRLVGMPGADVDDAVQDTFLRLCVADRHTIVDVAGWLIVVATRVCDHILTDKYNRKEHALPLHLEADVRDPSELALRRIAFSVHHVAIPRALEQIPLLQKRVVILRYYAEMPYEEIAPLLGISSNAARQLASRARGHIAKALSRSGDNLAEHAL